MSTIEKTVTLSSAAIQRKVLPQDERDELTSARTLSLHTFSAQRDERPSAGSRHKAGENAEIADCASPRSGYAPIAAEAFSAGTSGSGGRQ